VVPPLTPKRRLKERLSIRRLQKAASNRSQRSSQPSLTFQIYDVGEGRLLRWLRLDAALLKATRPDFWQWSFARFTPPATRLEEVIRPALQGFSKRV